MTFKGGAGPLTRPGWLSLQRCTGGSGCTSPPPEAERFRVRVGHGFIAQDNKGPDVFARYSEINGNGYRELAGGERVSFDIGQGQKGPQAQNIVRGPRARANHRPLPLPRRRLRPHGSGRSP